MDRSLRTAGLGGAVGVFPCLKTEAQPVSELAGFVNPLQTKRRPLYLKTQSVPRCKHFSST